jgi:hypothetical protein
MNLRTKFKKNKDPFANLSDQFKNDTDAKDVELLKKQLVELELQKIMNKKLQKEDPSVVDSQKKLKDYSGKFLVAKALGISSIKYGRQLNNQKILSDGAVALAQTEELMDTDLELKDLKEAVKYASETHTEEAKIIKLKIKYTVQLLNNKIS